VDQTTRGSAVARRGAATPDARLRFVQISDNSHIGFTDRRT